LPPFAFPSVHPSMLLLFLQSCIQLEPLCTFPFACICYPAIRVLFRSLDPGLVLQSHLLN
jgi:hypothetical protein